MHQKQTFILGLRNQLKCISFNKERFKRVINVLLGLAMVAGTFAEVSADKSEHSILRSVVSVNNAITEDSTVNTIDLHDSEAKVSQQRCTRYATLRRGGPEDPNYNNTIELAQKQLLKVEGTVADYIRNSGGADDDFGLGTYNAVVAYQMLVFPNQPSEHDGEIGPKTWDKLGCSVDHTPVGAEETNDGMRCTRYATLRRGGPEDPNYNNTIELAQKQLLKVEGTVADYIRNSGGADDDFGLGTYNAVVAYQMLVFPNQPSEHDGEIGPKTWDKLGCSVDHTPVGAEEPNDGMRCTRYATLRVDGPEDPNYNNTIELAQKQLLKVGGSVADYIRNSGGADDDFGLGTYNAVISYQRIVFSGQPNEHDGEIGPKTWDKLGCSTDHTPVGAPPEDSEDDPEDDPVPDARSCDGASETTVADGICLEVIDDKIYIATISLNDPDIEVELAYESDSDGFRGKRVEGFVKEDSGAGNGSNDFAHKFVAINATAHGIFGGKAREVACLQTTCKYESSGSVLGIDKGQIRHIDTDSLNTSFLAYREGSAKIHRATPADEEEAIDQGFPGNDDEIAESYITKQIRDSEFVIGYRSALLDTTKPNGERHEDFPAYVASDEDDPLLEEKTAIGLSDDGNTMYLAVTKSGVPTRDLADHLKQSGAERVILLDSSWSSQFLALSDSTVKTQFESRRASRTRKVTNSIVVYNKTSDPDTKLEVPSRGGIIDWIPKIVLGINDSTFANAVNLRFIPQVSHNLLSLEVQASGASTHQVEEEFGHVNQFFRLEATDLTSNQVLQPSKAYTIAISYEQSDIPANINEEDLSLHFFDDGAWIPEETSEVDVERNIITATPNHFGELAILAAITNKVYVPVITR